MESDRYTSCLDLPSVRGASEQKKGKKCVRVAHGPGQLELDLGPARIGVDLGSV